MLTAEGTTATGQQVESATILIDVERPDLPVSLSALMPLIRFKTQGEQSPVIILATFSDGAILDATRSSNLGYTSSNTAVATVDANGIVTGIAAGSSSIVASYSQAGQNAQVTIPVTVPMQPTVSFRSVSLRLCGKPVLVRLCRAHAQT